MSPEHVTRTSHQSVSPRHITSAHQSLHVSVVHHLISLVANVGQVVFMPSLAADRTLSLRVGAEVGSSSLNSLCHD